MNYTKPEITWLASASFVIHGGKTTASTPDSSNFLLVTTAMAYESDE